MMTYDDQGNASAWQLSNQGGLQKLELPAGHAVSRPPIKVDMGTHIRLIDPITRQQVGPDLPKNVAEVERQKGVGEAQGKAVAGATNQMAAADAALNTLDQIETNPQRTSATGWQSNFPTFRGGKTADFEQMVEQARGGAFLAAVQQMRGLGALTVEEGRQATAAINRMQIGSSDEGFMKALNDYRAIVQKGRAKAEEILRTQGASATSLPGQAQPQQPAAPPAPQTNTHDFSQQDLEAEARRRGLIK
jgi:hypothetical protein